MSERKILNQMSLFRTTGPWRLETERRDAVRLVGTTYLLHSTGERPKRRLTCRFDRSRDLGSVLRSASCSFFAAAFLHDSKLAFHFPLHRGTSCVFLQRRARSLSVSLVWCSWDAHRSLARSDQIPRRSDQILAAKRVCVVRAQDLDVPFTYYRSLAARN